MTRDHLAAARQRRAWKGAATHACTAPSAAVDGIGRTTGTALEDALSSPRFGAVAAPLPKCACGICRRGQTTANPMNKPIALAVILASLLVAGCASSPGGSSPSASSTPAAETPRIAPAVVVPAAAGKKLVLAMTGPKQVVEAKDWAEFQREWRETFAEHAKQAGVAFSFAESAPRPTGEDGTIRAVHVADYRIVGIGARIFFGVMTGNAFIEAKVKYISLRDGTTYGEQAYSTTSSAWGGIFAKVTPQQVDAIAANVFKDVAPAR